MYVCAGFCQIFVVLMGFHNFLKVAQHVARTYNAFIEACSLIFYAKIKEKTQKLLQNIFS